MTRRTPDRFERAVDRERLGVTLGLERLKIIRCDNAVKLLRREYAAVVRAVKKMKEEYAEQIKRYGGNAVAETVHESYRNACDDILAMLKERKGGGGGEMKLITERDNIRDVSRAWDEQYRNTVDEEKVAIGNKLRTLNLARASAKTVDAIIGNSSWTVITCSACSEDVKAAVEFRYWESVLTVCFPCLKKAVRMAP